MPSITDSAGDTNPSGTGAPPRNLPTSYRDSAPPILALLLAFRLTNALALHTFFQPDEFFQSLEPAWQLAFGDASNAWITWVNFSPPSSHPPLTTTPTTTFRTYLIYIHFAHTRLQSHHMSRSGQAACALPCTQRYLQPSIVSRHMSLKPVD